MEIAVIIAAGLRDWIDFGVIIGILMLNATVGWYQEKQAADVVASLKGDIAMRTTALRDGEETEIKARELVPGDVVSVLGLVITVSTQLTFFRSLSKTAKLSPLTAELSLPTTTPTDGQTSKRSLSDKLARKSSTRARTTTTWKRSTAPATLFSPLINLP